jgi:hypothetical protein
MQNKNFIAARFAAICSVSVLAFVACTNNSTVAADMEGSVGDINQQTGNTKILNEDPVLKIASLENYVAQFTDDPNELSFDSHVLAYNGNFPRIVIPQDSLNANPNIIAFDNSPITEITTSEVAKYFPNTAEVAGNRLNQENCKLYIVQANDAAQPTGHILTKVSQGQVEVTEVVRGGFYAVTCAFFPVAFLVQDCEGLIDRNSQITYKGFTSRTWCGDTKKTRDELMVGDSLDLNQSRYKPNPNCTENAHTDVSAYGEWFRADLAE